MLKKYKNIAYNFLRWTEKWTKTDMVYLSKGGFWLSIGQVVSTLSGFLLSLAFANLIPIEVNGKYSYIISLSGFFSIASLGGMQTAINRASAQNLDGTLKQGMYISFKYGLLGSLASIAIAIYYYFNDNISLTFSFLIMAFFAPYLGSLNSYSSFLSGKKEFKLTTIINILKTLLILLLTSAFLYLTDNVLILILAYFSIRAVFDIILTWYTIKNKVNNDNFTKESLSFGKHMSLMSIIEMIADRIDKILIWHYLGGVQLAIYSYAMAPVNQIQGAVMKNISGLVTPKLAENSISHIKKSLPAKIWKLIFIVAIIALTYFIMAPFFYKTFFPQYTAAINYSRLYLITIIFMPLGLLNSVLIAHGRKKELYTLSFSMSILKITLFLVLLPFYGVMGAISTILIVNLFGYSLLGYLFKKMK